MSFRTLPLVLSQLVATPGTPVITQGGTPGSTTYAYTVVGKSLDTTKRTVASAQGSTSTGNATLSVTNYNTATWATQAGATGGFDIYRKVGGATTGLIGSVAAGVYTFNDTGLAGDSSIEPTTNTSGDGPWSSNCNDLSFKTWTLDDGGAAVIATVQLQGRMRADGHVFDLGTAMSAQSASLVTIPETLAYFRAKMTSYTSGYASLACLITGIKVIT